MRHKIPLREARAAFDQRRPFDCNGTLRGYAGPPREWGRLTAAWVAWARRFRGDIVYTAVSYYTPIAFVMSDGEVVVPPVSYSATTTRHSTTLGLRWSPRLNYDWGVAA